MPSKTPSRGRGHGLDPACVPLFPQATYAPWQESRKRSTQNILMSQKRPPLGHETLTPPCMVTSYSTDRSSPLAPQRAGLSRSTKPAAEPPLQAAASPARSCPAAGTHRPSHVWPGLPGFCTVNLSRFLPVSVLPSGDGRGGEMTASGVSYSLFMAP